MSRMILKLYFGHNAFSGTNFRALLFEKACYKPMSLKIPSECTYKRKLLRVKQSLLGYF